MDVTNKSQTQAWDFIHMGVKLVITNKSQPRLNWLILEHELYTRQYVMLIDLVQWRHQCQGQQKPAAILGIKRSVFVLRC